MFISNPLCNLAGQMFGQQYILYLVALVFICIFLFLVIKTTKSIKKTREKLTVSVGIFLAIFIIWIIISALIAFNLGLIDDFPPSADYHPLNAMIKYRCYQDHKYCPMTDKDVWTIAPDYERESLQDAQITYDLDRTKQNYTLIIRNNNYHLNNDRVVIFDPRLIGRKDYGYGLDFFDANITPNCDGTFKIVNPPPFPGPWNNIK